MDATKQALILHGCFDDLANAPHLAIHSERTELAQSIIDALGDYPRPTEKGSDTAPDTKELGAYLYTSTARNTLKLALLGYVCFEDAFIPVYGCFELALSLLTDNQ